jgi:hypothetical protein
MEWLNADAARLPESESALLQGGVELTKHVPEPGHAPHPSREHLGGVRHCSSRQLQALFKIEERSGGFWPDSTGARSMPELITDNS